MPGELFVVRKVETWKGGVEEGKEGGREPGICQGLEEVVKRPE